MLILAVKVGTSLWMSRDVHKGISRSCTKNVRMKCLDPAVAGKAAVICDCKAERLVQYK